MSYLNQARVVIALLGIILLMQTIEIVILRTNERTLQGMLSECELKCKVQDKVKGL
jgi:uncharacterized membrane-anchored protein